MSKQQQQKVWSREEWLAQWRRGKPPFEHSEGMFWWIFIQGVEKYEPDGPRIYAALRQPDNHSYLKEGATYESDNGYFYKAKTVHRKTDGKVIPLVEKLPSNKDKALEGLEDEEEIAHQAVEDDGKMGPPAELNRKLAEWVPKKTTMTPSSAELLLADSYKSRNPLAEIERAKVHAILMINDTLVQLVKEQQLIAQHWRDFNDHIQRFGFR